MKKIEAIIFDWAGTTVDYGCMAPIKAMQAAFAHSNLDISLQEIRKPMGLAKLEHIKAVLAEKNRKFTDEEIDKIYHYFERHIMTNLHEFTDLIPGILEVQEYLRQRNIKIGSTTGYTKAMMDIVSLEAHKKGYQPDCIITPDQVTQGRPQPFMLQRNLLRLGINDIGAVVKVGDTIADILEGVNAGCWSIGVIRGSSMLGLSVDEANHITDEEFAKRSQEVKNQMHAAGAHFVMEKMSDLPNVIKKIEEGQLC